MLDLVIYIASCCQRNSVKFLRVNSARLRKLCLSTFDKKRIQIKGTLTGIFAKCTPKSIELKKLPIFMLFYVRNFVTKFFWCNTDKFPTSVYISTSLPAIDQLIISTCKQTQIINQTKIARTTSQRELEH